MRRVAQSRRGSDAQFFIILITSTFLMGSSFVAGKILLAQGFPAMLLVGWRFLVAALATLPLVRLDNRSVFTALMPRGFALRDFALVIVIGILQTTAVMGLLFIAMRSISAATAAILLFTNPIWVAVLGRLFLGEALHRSRVVGLAVGIAGVVLAIGISGQGQTSSSALIGELIGLGSAICWAAATIINKRANLPLGSWSLSFWQMLIGALVILVLAYGAGEHWPATTTHTQWGWLTWLAIPASTGSFGLWFVALNRGGATKTSGYLFLAPLFTVILSYFVLGTSLSWMQAFGGLLIGVALWLLNRDAPGRNQNELMSQALAEGRP
jgi:drug/metabolite transporter (DMT)-like permease